MSATNSILAYPDCAKALNRALESTKGIIVTFDNAKDAIAFQRRCYAFRRIDRKDNMSLYPEGHQLYARSIYDVCYLIQEGPDLRIEVRKIDWLDKAIKVIE